MYWYTLSYQNQDQTHLSKHASALDAALHTSALEDHAASKSENKSVYTLPFPISCSRGYACQPKYHTPCDNCQGWSSKTSCATSAPNYAPLSNCPYCICSPYHCPYQFDETSHYNPSAAWDMIPLSYAALVTHQHVVYGACPLVLPIPLESKHNMDGQTKGHNWAPKLHMRFWNFNLGNYHTTY